MWSNFFVQQDEEGRIGVAGAGQPGGLAGMKGGRVHRRPPKMSDSQEGKIKLAFFVCIIGVTLTVLGMGTEFWVELAQPKNFSGNQTCQMAHYGLWKGCVRTLWVADIDPERTSCGPAELPGGETSGGRVSVRVCVPLSVCPLCCLAGEQVSFLEGMCLLCFSDCLLASASLQRQLPNHASEVHLGAASAPQSVHRPERGVMETGQKVRQCRSRGTLLMLSRKQKHVRLIAAISLCRRR